MFTCCLMPATINKVAINIVISSTGDLILSIMNNIYEDDGVAIHSEAFDTDLDEIGFEPQVIEGDNDEEAANEFGY